MSPGERRRKGGMLGLVAAIAVVEIAGLVYLGTRPIERYGRPAADHDEHPECAGETLRCGASAITWTPMRRATDL